MRNHELINRVIRLLSVEIEEQQPHLKILETAISLIQEVIDDVKQELQF